MEHRAGPSASGHETAHVRDRRVDRTRGAVIAAFNALLFERGYARVSVRDVIDRANVGRSTFYEHFQNKHDVLEQAMTPILAPLADAVSPAHDDRMLRATVAHIWDVRRFTVPIVSGAARPLVARLLARMIEERLERRRGVAPVPRSLIAAMLAGAQIAALEAWVGGTAAATPDAMASALAAMTAAASGAVQTER